MSDSDAPMTQNAELLVTLQKLKSGSAHALILYEQLYRGTFTAIVSDPHVSIPELSFYGYPCDDGVTQVPIFTSTDRADRWRLDIQGSD